MKNLQLSLFIIGFAQCLNGQNLSNTHNQYVKDKIVEILLYIGKIDKDSFSKKESCYIETVIDSSYFYDNFVKSQTPIQCEIGFRIPNSGFFCMDSFNCGYKRDTIYEFVRNNYLSETEFKYYIDKIEVNTNKFDNCFLLFKTYNLKEKYLYENKYFSSVLIVELKRIKNKDDSFKYSIIYQCLIPVDSKH